MKRIFTTIVLLTSVIFISPQVGFGGEPVPPGMEIGGPAVRGELILENQRDEGGVELQYMTVTFRGFCKAEYVKIKTCEFPFPAAISTFADINKDILWHYILLGWGPPDCNSECGREDIIITKVNKFKFMKVSKKSPYQDIIVADVVFRFLIPIPE